MSRTTLKTPASSPRLLASAIGVALGASSVAHLAQAAEDTGQKGQRNSISLGATSITGEEQDNTSYQVEKASSQKYTAPLVDTPRSVTVVPQQVLKDTAATSLQDALRTVPGITFGAGEVVTHRGIARSSVVLTPRATPTWTAYATPAARAVRSSTLNPLKSARARIPRSAGAARPVAASTW